MVKKKNFLESRLGEFTKIKSEYRHCSVSSAFMFTASAAAGLGALICPPPAEAAVKYSGLKNLSMGTNAPAVVHNIDLDGDGVDDFYFLFANNGYQATIGSYRKYANYRAFVIGPASQNGVIGEMSIINSGTYPVPARLPNNYTVQDVLPAVGRNWLVSGSSNLLASRVRYYFKGYSGTNPNSTMVTSNVTYTGGKFPGRRGYLGVRFEISSETHYGWIEFETDEDLKNGKIIDWAYEDQPETPIRAGDGRFNWSLFAPAIANGAKQRLEQNSD